MIFWVEESGNIMKHHKNSLKNPTIFKSSNCFSCFFLIRIGCFFQIILISEGEKSALLKKKANRKKRRKKKNPVKALMALLALLIGSKAERIT